MANQQAFESGYEQGYDVLAQNRAHKQALSDEEHEAHITDLFDQRKAILSNPTLADTDKALKLQDVAAQLREAYHPDKHPGALQKFGHLITDNMRITDPMKRAKKEGDQKAARSAGDEKTAQGWMSEAPVSPDQQERINAQAQATGQKITDEAREKYLSEWFDRNSADKSPEAKQRFLQEAMGLYARGTYGSITTYKNPDGTTFQAQRGPDGRIIYPNTGEEVDPQVLQAAVPFRPVSTKKSAGDILVDAYIAGLKSPAKGWDELTPEQRANYPKWKNGLAQKTTTHRTLVTDRDGTPHVIDLTSITSPVEVFNTPAQSPTAPITPNASGNGGGSGKNTPRVKPDTILDFKKTTPQYTKDLARRNDAESSYLDVKNAGPGDGQVLDPVGSQGIIMSWLKGRVNRVTATEIQSVNNLGGAEMKLEGNYVRLVSGTISPQQYQWFLDSARRNFENAQTILAQDGNPSSGQQTPGTDQGGFDWNNPQYAVPAGPK